MTIMYFILAVLMFFGLIRVLFSPYNGIVNLFMELILVDWLIDGIGWCIESISELWEDE